MQKRFLDLQLDLEERTETVSRLLQQAPVDEAKVLAAVDQVLVLENQVKKAQLSLLVRIKNQLTAAQLAKLDAGLGRAP
jgi:Spy/CpxP family protein refolding chaperone